MADASARPLGFEALTPIAQRLNTASDDLNAAIKKIEDRLNSMALGIEHWVPIPETRDERSDPHDDHVLEEWEEIQLGYERTAEGWALQIRSAHFTDTPDPAHTRPEHCWEFGGQKLLSRAPRDLRVLAVRAIPDLIAALTKEAKTMLAVVEQAEAIAFSADDLDLRDDDLTDEAALTVRCQVSERWLKFRPDSSNLKGGEFVTFAVMTTNGEQRRQRRLCLMIVTREDLLRALSHVKPA